MIQATLRLRYMPHAVRPVVGWFVTSADPRDWLDQATRCFASSTGHSAVDQSRIRILPIPRSRHERDPAGALILPDVDGGIEIPHLSSSTRRLPYGRIGDRLFVPVESRLDPEVLDDEWPSLLSAHLTYVWHPATGLVALESHERLSMADLIRSGAPQPRRWDRAQPGEHLAARLIALAPLDPPSMEMVLRQGQDDIGSQSDEISDLPPMADEPQPGLGNAVGRAGLRILAGGAEGIRSLLRRTGAGLGGRVRDVSGCEGRDGEGRHRGRAKGGAEEDRAGGPGWLDRLAESTRRRLEHLNRAILSEREKELSRLMNLLETDPDQGLRYALPVGGDTHRGLAPPSNRLGKRNTDFSLGRLGGGRAADAWDVSAQDQQRLIIRYRELANRELQLGRHRRAAYIFAELLADFEAAAGALNQGRHWREAAVLYRERLSRPLDAAECLEQGELWTEAGELYLELEEHEKAGDLFMRLEQHELARKRYEMAVEKCRSRSDWLGSARILQDKLDRVDESIGELASAWPHTGQAIACLRKLLETLGRLGRHDAAAEQIRGMREATVPQHWLLPLIETLADRATSYPDREVRAISADSARVLASRILTRGPGMETTRVLRAVRALAPEDRLLSRDCARFGRQQAIPASPATRIARPRGNSPELVRSIHLPRHDPMWRAEAGVASAGVVFVAGLSSQGMLSVYRCGWDGDLDPCLTWTGMPTESELILAASANRPDWLLIHAVGSPLRVPAKEFLETEACPFRSTAGASRGMTPGVIAASVTGRGITWLLEQRNHVPTLIALGSRGELLGSQALLEIGAELFSYLDQNRSVPMDAEHVVHLGVDHSAYIFTQSKMTKLAEFDRPIRSIISSLPDTRPRVAIAFDKGAMVSWDNFADGGRTHRFSPDLPEPLVTFNRGGLLIAAHGRTCEVHSTMAQRVDLKGQFELPGRAVAVLPAVRRNQFGVLLESGVINLYQVA